MNIYARELKKLQKLDKAIKKYQSYNIPCLGDYIKLRDIYHKTVVFTDDISNRLYYQLYRQYGDRNRDIYENKLILFVNYSQHIRGWLLKQTLTPEEYKNLLKYYKSLKLQLKLILDAEDLHKTPYLIQWEI